MSQKLISIKNQKIEFDWPDFRTTFPYKRSVAYTRALVDKCSEDCSSLSNFVNKSFESYRNTGLFAAFMYPECSDTLKMEVLIKIMMFFFIMDDHTEYEWGDAGRNEDKSFLIWTLFEKSFEIYLGKHVSQLDWKPYILGFHTCFHTIFGSYSMTQKKRCAEVWQDYALGNIEESRFYENQQFNSVSEVIQMRKKSIGVRAVFQLIEYSEGIELTEEEWNNQIFQQIIDVGVESLFLVNDFYSFRKEIEECKGDLTNCRNLIALFVNLENLSLQEAVNKLIKMIVDTEVKIWELEDKYKATEHLSETMKHFIKCYNYVVGGNWIVHVGLDRYTGKAVEKAKIISGHFVYDKDRTIVLNNNQSSESLRKYFEI